MSDPPPPPLSLDLTARRGRAWSVPPPLLIARGLRARLRRGGPSWSWAPSARGVPVVCVWGLPPCRCCTPLAHAAGQRVPLSLPPLYGFSFYARAAVRGGSSSPSSLGYPTLRARSGGPLPGPVAPLAVGSHNVPLWGPSLALAARPGRAPLGGGDPSPFPPSSAACIKRSRLFGGRPLRHRLVGRLPRHSLAPRGVVPPCRLFFCAG